MATDETHGRIAAFIEKAKALLMRPKETWPEIYHDMTPSGELFTRYAMPLTALAPAIGFLTGRIFGWNPFGFNIIGQLFTAASGWAVGLVNLLIMSFIASKLAPRFGGDGSPRDAFKLIVWSSTAAWLAAAAAAIPGFAWLNIAGFYSLYLYFTGIGPMMKVPEENKKRFGVVTIACSIGLLVMTSALTSGFGPRVHVNHNPRNEVRINGDEVKFDGEKFGREMRDAFQRRGAKSVSGTDLQALLPATIGSFHRTAIENSGGPVGQAEATYEDGNKEFTIKLIDLVGFAGMATAFNVEKNREDEDGFEHVRMKDGQMVIEKWDNDDEEGEYKTVVDKRFMIQVEGEADTFDQLKAAATSVDRAKLISLEKK